MSSATCVASGWLVAAMPLRAMISERVANGLPVMALPGLSERWNSLFSASVWASLWALYLSLVNVGQVFYGFGWEMILLETGFLAIFLGSAQPPRLVFWLLLWELFRIMFGAG